MFGLGVLSAEDRLPSGIDVKIDLNSGRTLEWYGYFLQTSIAKNFDKVRVVRYYLDCRFRLSFLRLHF